MLNARNSLVVSFAVVAASLACAPSRECNAQNDCPIGEGCTANGRCVAESPDVVLADARADGVEASSSGGAASTRDDDGGSTGSTMNGALGPVSLVDAPASGQKMIGGNYVITAVGDLATGLGYVFCSGTAPPDLTTPGTRSFSANDPSAAVFGEVSTSNEKSGTQPFNALTDITIAVASTGVVDLTWKTDGVNLSAHLPSAPQ